MVQKNDLHRKKFLQLSARIAISLAGILGLGGLARYFSHQLDSGNPSRFELGPVEDFPISGILILPDAPAVIYKTDVGFTAYSLVCTHLGCTLEKDGENFSCPCHGSKFDPDGRVLSGPATESLPELKVNLQEDGLLVLETGEVWR